MTTSSNPPQFQFQAISDQTGEPLVFGLLYTYISGTNTPQATFTDQTGTVQATNPVVLSVDGKATLWLNPVENYRFDLWDATNLYHQQGYPIDNVAASGGSGASNILTQLANTTSASEGQGLVGFNPALSYPANTLPNALASTAAGQGAGLVGYNSSLGYTAGTVGAALAGAATGVTAANLVQQTATAFSTGGTGAAYTLVSGQAFTTNVANRRFNATFALAGSGTPTFAVDTAPALPLVAYNNLGVLVSYLPPAGLVSDVECNGTQWIVLDPLGAPVPPKSSRSNLQASTTGSSAVTTISADALTVVNANGQGVTGTVLSLTNTLTSAGANGLDTGSAAYSTWYYIWAIFNLATGVWASLASLSPTSPTLPSGYTYKALVSAIRTQAATNYYPLRFNQCGDTVEYQPMAGTNVTVSPVMISGPSGTEFTAMTAVPMAAFIPPNTSKIKVALSAAASNATAGAGPQSAYAASINVPLVVVATAGGAPMGVVGEFIVASTNFYFAGSSGTQLACLSFSMNL
jgi:hypothetical protein